MIARLALAAMLLAAHAGVALPARSFVSPDGSVHLSYPPDLKPGRDFTGRSLMTGGWRLMWDGGEPGPGQGIVRLEKASRAKPGAFGASRELLQIGVSRDPAVRARCLRFGLGDGKRLPDRVLGGRRWAAYRHGDAGMSQSIEAIDLRTVASGACYAVSRITYGVAAVDTPPPSVPSQASVAAEMDRVLASLRITAPRR